MNLIGNSRKPSVDGAPPKKSPFYFFVLLAINAVIIATGTIYYRFLETHSRLNAETALSHIAQSKLDQLINWREEQLKDAAILAENPFVKENIASLIQAPQSTGALDLTNWLETYLARYHYTSISILDGERISVYQIPFVENETTNTIHKENPEWLEEAVLTRKPILTDIHRDPITRVIHIGSVIPIYVHTNDSLPVGFLVLQFDLSRFLYPLIESWPTNSQTGETLLVRKEGDDVLFLSNLRYRPNSALEFRIPLAQKDLPAGLAIGGATGAVAGRDYRGEKVFSVLRSIPDTNWYMVVKIDQNEALSGWLDVSRNILIMLCALVLATGSFFLWMWYRQNKNYYRDLYLTANLAEKKLLEESTKLKVSEERFRKALQLSPFPAMLHAENGKVLLVNQQWCVLTGYAPEEISTIGDWTELAYGTRNEEIKTYIESLYQQNEKLNEGIFNIRCKDGSTRMWDFASMPMGRDTNGLRLVLSMAMDVTEKQEMQNRLSQAEKLNSIGQLAGGVAHDFNNLLMGIMNYVDICLLEVEPGSNLHEWLNEINSIAERSAGITRQLLAFARKQAISPKVLDLNSVVPSMHNMLQRLIGEDIAIQWEPEKDLWSIMMDSSQLDQILTNLCVNARDAIPGVGNITIAAKNISIDTEFALSHAEATPGDYVVLTVSDNGCGMDEETLQHAFEPFYTSKAFGKGTGLGLATVYGIVKQNKGFLEVRSQQNVGTTLDIYFPRHVETIHDTESIAIPAKPCKQGHETILLTEDEPAIRKTIEMGLTHRGYKVLSAENPEQGFRLVDEYNGNIDLLITDLIMPGMNGYEFAIALQQKNPNLKVIYMSGYNQDIIVEKGVLKQGVTFISKPFAAKDLEEKIRKLLDGDVSEA